MNYLYNNSDLEFYKLVITFRSINRFAKKYYNLHIFSNKRFLLFFYIIYYCCESLYLKSVDIDI